MIRWGDWLFKLFFALCCVLVLVFIIWAAAFATKKVDAGAAECGSYRVVATNEKKTWLPFIREGVIEVTCATDKEGVARTVEVKIR